MYKSYSNRNVTTNSIVPASSTSPPASATTIFTSSGGTSFIVPMLTAPACARGFTHAANCGACMCVCVFFYFARPSRRRRALCSIVLDSKSSSSVRSPRTRARASCFIASIGFASSIPARYAHARMRIIEAQNKEHLSTHNKKKSNKMK